MKFDESLLYNIKSDYQGIRYSLFDLAIWKNGLAFKKIDFSDKGLPVIKIAELNNGISSNTSFTQGDYGKEVFVQWDDLLFSWSGNPQTSIDVFRYRLPDGWLNQHIFKVTANSELVTKDFLYYTLKYLKPYFTQIATNKQTTGLGHVTIADLKRMSVVIPKKEIQEQVTSILKVIDDKIEVNSNINENLNQQIESILLSMFSSAKTDCVRLGDYLYIKGRIGWKGLKKDEYLDQSKYRIINGESLTKSGVDWLKAGYISKNRYIESPEIMLKEGDILLSKDGTIGKIGYIDSLETHATVASGIFVIRNIKPEIISTTFIYYLLKSRLFKGFIAARTEGSVIPHLYQKDFMQFEFPLPSSDEMKAFDAITKPMFSMIIGNLQENQKLSRLRDELLSKLMSGELDVSVIDL